MQIKSFEIYLTKKETNFSILLEDGDSFECYSFQISIDTTGPHPGEVLDGLQGQPEKDFQKDLNIHGHWDGFFDKESGIAFYKFKYGAQCFTTKHFSLSDKTGVSQDLRLPFLINSSWQLTLCSVYTKLNAKTKQGATQEKALALTESSLQALLSTSCLCGT